MNANTREFEILDGLVEQVVGAVYEVANVLGAGLFGESLRKGFGAGTGVARDQSHVAGVVSRGLQGAGVGEYMADLLVEERLIVELKCMNCFANEHIAQCVNYLRPSGVKLYS